MSDTLDRVKDIVVKLLNVDKGKITPESKFIDDLGADSLDAVEIVMMVEEEFNIEIPDDADGFIKTVGDITKYIEERL
jgi:acyl carrier protein|tara:strand:- start:444 stop:677 length:234 start_codon:yes stop_codon:yes gene_type:complete